MALLEANPLVVVSQDRQKSTFFFNGIQKAILNVHRDILEKRCEWACDETGGETTHEATYGTDGYELLHAEPQIARGSVQGTWVEIYRKYGTWTAD